MRGIRVLTVNEQESDAVVRGVLRDAGISIECIMPTMPGVERIMKHLDKKQVGAFARYDVVVVEPIEPTLAGRIVRAINVKFPNQRIIVVGGEIDAALDAIFVRTRLGVIDELKRIQI